MDHLRLSFRSWLKQHRKADTALGDLARDVLADPSWPRGRGSLDTYRDHMRAHGAIEVLERAWEQYNAQDQASSR